MRDKELYRQKRQAQLDEWKADVSKMKAKAAELSADAKLELNRQINEMDSRIEQGNAKLAEIAATSEDAWASIKDGMDSAWDSLASAVKDARRKVSKASKVTS